MSRYLTSARCPKRGGARRGAVGLALGLLLVAVAGLATVASPGCEGVQPARDQPPARPGPRARARTGRDPGREGPAKGKAAGERLEVTDLFGKTPLAGRPLKKITWSHDGRWLYFLRPNAEDARVLDLWRQKVQGTGPGRSSKADKADKAELLVAARTLREKGTAELTEEQKAARERRRVRHRGITRFVLDRKNTGVLIPYQGLLYHLDLSSRSLRRVFPEPGGELDPRFGPDGRRIAFVRQGNLYVRDLATGRERALTRDGGGAVKNGVAEFVAQEELRRFRGYWWSPDGAYLAFARVDESAVRKVQRHRISARGVEVVTQRYPAAGTPNAAVKLGVVQVATGLTRWLQGPPAGEHYLARVRWVKGPVPGATARARANPRPAPRALRVAVQWLSRDQQTLRLLLADPRTGAARTVLTEQDPAYVNLHDDLRPLDDGRRFLWSTERSGARQLELRAWPAGAFQADAGGGAARRPVGWDSAGAQPKPLASPTPKALSRAPLHIHEVVGLDEPGGWVYATVPTERALQLHLYRFALDGQQPPQRVSQTRGWHEVDMSRRAAHYVDRFSHQDRPPRVTLHRASGEAVRVLDPNDDARWGRFARARTSFVTLRAADDTPLNGLLFWPPADGASTRRRRGREENSGRPAVIYTYGGPHGHSVARRWRRMTPWHHFLAQRGFVVLVVDGRGTDYRGKAFEVKLHRKFGEVDAADVAAAARWLGRRPGVDADRIGLWGWSYGGYLSAMTALRTGRLLRAVVAVAPVTDWRLYDTAYTERYLGHPDQHPEAYRRSNPVRLADKLDTRLLLIHGMADDNVLLRHTLLLSQALQRAGRRFDMMLYPGKAHSIKGTRIRRHLLTTLLSYFRQHLQTTPPEK